MENEVSKATDFLSKYKEDYKSKQSEEMSLTDYLEICKEDKLAYAGAAERLLAAIGDPEVVDTSKDPELSRVFQNKTITRYPAFDDFYDAEGTVEQIVDFLKSAATGLEEKKQILYLLGPVGGGKSSLAERIKDLMEEKPIYVLKHKPTNQISPLNESPLCLFNPKDHGEHFEEEFGISRRNLKTLMSPWAVKRLEESGGNLDDFSVVKMNPSRLNQIAIAKTEPGDENNQDISALVGKVDIRKLEEFEQNDPDAYSYSGGLCKGNQGVMEFVEMFKAPIKVLHPLLTATQEGNYNGTEAIGALPFDGLILAHSNESEWTTFRNNKNNEAFLDRVSIVKVPYSLRVSEEKKIYEKLLKESDLSDAHVAPHTLDLLAQWSVLTRLVEPQNSNIYSKMRVYDGENLKDIDPKAKSVQEYKDAAGTYEGMEGGSPRFAFKTLSKVFNYNSVGDGEVAADPVQLMYVLEQRIIAEDYDDATRDKYIGFLREQLQPKYVDFIGKEIQTAYLESYSEYGQNIFDRYVTYADLWMQDQDYRDPNTGEMLNRAALDEELQKIERPAGISNPKDFRNEVVNFVLRARAKNGGENPNWTSYRKLRGVIEKNMFQNTEELLPVISFTAKSNAEEQKKHQDFVQRMTEHGYSPTQVKRVCDWYIRMKKASGHSI